MQWIKASESLPPLFKKVEWRNAPGGNIPLGEDTLCEIYKKASGCVDNYEWLDESTNTTPTPSTERVSAAMQEFIDTATHLRELNPTQDVMPTKYYKERLLQKAKQIVIDAWEDGEANQRAFQSIGKKEFNSGADYFNKKFKQ